VRAAEGAIEAGTVLVGKYRIESVLGRGGMGMVYRAQHLALGEDVAIKVLRRDVSLDEETVMRFLREAQSAVKLKSEHVARIQDVGACDDGLPFMVMEFLQGADLGQMVDAHGAMSIPVAVDLVLQACDAIVEAHSLGIVHRDVKPSNLFVSFRPDQSAIVKVLDFGISKSANGSDMSLTQTQSMLGTPAYMSPEQMRSARSVDARTDIWSLGTVLYELVEARRPFEAESFSEMCVMVAVDAPARMTNATDIEPIITRCLAKKPQDRYPHVAELMRDLAPFAGNYEAANHYVKRAFRTLGLGVPTKLESSPSIQRPSYPALHLGPTPTEVHDAASAAMATPTPVPDVPTYAPTLQDPKAPVHRGSGRWFVMVTLFALLGVGGTIAIVKASSPGEHASTASGGATRDVGAGSASATTGTAGTSGGSPATGAGAGRGSAATGEVATGSAGATAVGDGRGSAATGAGAGRGSAATGEVSTGSASATAVGDGRGSAATGDVGTGRGSAGTGDGRGSAVATSKPPIAKPPIAKPPIAKPPIAKPPVAKPPVVKPPDAAPPAVAKPCGSGGDPFSAPRPCKTS
jgi:serine/threonine-protein kinase